MDRRHLEPGPRVYENQPGMQALLRGNFCGALSGGEGPSLREQGFELRLVPEKLNEPFQWRSPKLVFVNSMSDLFHAGVPDDYVEAVSRVMAIADWHTYQVLTKRSERLCGLLNGKLRFAADRENIWWGVSVEDRKHGLPRVATLAAIARESALFVDRAASRRSWENRPLWHRLGNRGRRKRTRRSTDE